MKLKNILHSLLLTLLTLALVFLVVARSQLEDPTGSVLPAMQEEPLPLHLRPAPVLSLRLLPLRSPSRNTLLSLSSGTAPSLPTRTSGRAAPIITPPA